MEQMSKVSMKEIAIVGDSALLTTGFSLSGVKKTFMANTEEEAEESIRKILEDDGIGIVIIASKLSNRIQNKKIRNIIESSIMPMFVPIPSYKEEVMEEEVLRNLIIRAIGIDITK